MERIGGFFSLNLFGRFQKYWYPQIIHFDRVFYYKPSILGYPYFLETPICTQDLIHVLTLDGKLIFTVSEDEVLDYSLEILGLQCENCLDGKSY